MLRDLNLTNPRGRTCDTYRCGVLAADIPATGENGPSMLYNDVLPGDPAGTEYRVEILTLPSAGVLDVDAAGRLAFIGAPDGTYTGDQRVLKVSPAGGAFEATTYSLTIGALTAGADLAIAYSVATTAGASLAVSYELLAPGVVGLNLGLYFDVMVATGADLTLAISTLTATGVDLPVGYDILTAVGASLNISFTVEAPGVPLEPITLAEAKAHLRVVFDDEDAYISTLITAAREMAEGRTQRAIVLRDEVLALDCFATPIRLPYPPLRTVAAIDYDDQDGAQQTLDDTAYRVNDYVTPARITRASGATWPTTAVQEAAVRVRYSCGYPTPSAVPVSLRQWMLLAIGALYENRESVTAGVQTYALPEDFMALLLQPHVVYM